MPSKITDSKLQPPLVKLRPAQEEVFWSDEGLLFMLWRRQYGKSHTLGSWALRMMAEMRGCSVFFVSAAILLGTENIRKEAEIWQHMILVLRAMAEADGKQLVTNADGLDVDAIADLFEHSKLETKLWHDRTSYSRSRVVAPNPATAVGWTGHVAMDEVGRIPDLKDMIEAVEPFMSSNPQFKWRMASTPPPRDDHYSWEIIVPPEDEFAVNARGNWYKSKAGILVHRCDVFDAFEAGTPMYHPETRLPITPQESRALAFDKSAWDRNYALKFLRGGLAAISIQQLFRAMELGKNEGVCASITEEVTLV